MADSGVKLQQNGSDEEQAWHRHIPLWGIFLLALLLLGLSVPVILSWVAVLGKREFSQNVIQLLVLALLGLALTRLDQRIKPVYKPSRYGFMWLIIAGLGYIGGAMLSIHTLFWASYLAILAALFYTLFGFWCFYSWLALFIFSLFLLPQMPADAQGGISLPLQMLSTKLTVLTAGLFIPIQASGNIFYIHNHPFEVTPACSGLNTWIGFMFAGLMWLLFERFSFKALLAIIIGAPILALLTNTLRLFVTALVAYWGNADMAVSVHTNLEYILFPIGLILMWLIGRRVYAEAGRLEDPAETSPEPDPVEGGEA